jgi:hypothetical protein
MEYVYMDQSKPTNFTGVAVTINVIDSNGNYRTIGTATTDASGYYSLQWVPDITGKFTVVATFAGSNSYYGSYSETSFAVDPAAATSSPQATQSPGMADIYFLPAVIGIIIAVAVVGIAILLALKKRP